MGIWIDFLVRKWKGLSLLRIDWVKAYIEKDSYENEI